MFKISNATEKFVLTAEKREKKTNQKSKMKVKQRMKQIRNKPERRGPHSSRDTLTATPIDTRL